MSEDDPRDAVSVDAATPKSAACYRNLREHQDQLDSDGVMVGVSRQALEETLAIYDAMAFSVEAAAPFLRLADEVINAPPMSDGYMDWLAEAKDWMVVFSFAGKSITLGDLRRAASVVPAETRQ